MLPEDYAAAAENLTQASDAKNVIDFMLHLLDERCLQDEDVNVNIEHRARRFMFKVFSKIPVVPLSMTVTGVSIPAVREYIGAGAFGLVFKGELRGSAVALKVLYRSGNSDVVSSFIAVMASYLISFTVGLLSRGISVALSEAQIRASVFRNLYRPVNNAIVPCFAVYAER